MFEFLILHTVNEKHDSLCYVAKQKTNKLEFDKTSNKLIIHGKEHLWHFDLEKHQQTYKPEVCETESSSENWILLEQKPYIKKSSGNHLTTMKVEVKMTETMYKKLKTWCLVNF